MNKIGPRTEPCGTPHKSCTKSDLYIPSLLFPWLSSRSHSRPLEISNYSPIPIYSLKVIPISSHSHSRFDWNTKNFKKSISSAQKRNNEWFLLRYWSYGLTALYKSDYYYYYYYKIIHYCIIIVCQSSLMKWKPECLHYSEISKDHQLRNIVHLSLDVTM